MMDLGVVPSTLVTIYVNMFFCRYSKNPFLFSSHLVSGFSDAIIAGIVVASFVAFFCCVLIIALPFCICCCLGVGIGAAAGSAGASTYSNI